MMKFTTTPGTAKILNPTPSENYIVRAALVADEYDTVTQPEARHWKLLEEMIRLGHWGCLDHCAVTVKIEAPIFVARQIMRASGASFNEVSGRYKVLDGRFYMPDTFYTDVKRKELGGEPEPLEDQEDYLYLYKDAVEESWAYYKTMIDQDFRKEQARMVLPLCTFTEFWMTLKLSDWLHFLNLRTDAHAQEETRYIANVILDQMRERFPKVVGYWERYAKGPINEHGTIQTP